MTSDRNPPKGFGVVRDADGFREVVVATRDELDADLRTRSERRPYPTDRS